MPITIYPGTIKKRNANGTYSDLVPGTDVHASEIEGLQDIVGDGQLSGFTETDLTGAANELKNSLNSKYEKPSGGIPDSDIASASTWNGKATKPDMATVAISAAWSGSGPYTQTVTVSGATVTANSKVDLQPNADQIAQLIEDGVQALYIANNNGTLTAYAVGAETSAAMIVQCTVTEVIA